MLRRTVRDGQVETVRVDRSSPSERLLRRLAVPLLDDPDVDEADLVPLVDPWTPGVEVEAGAVRSFGGRLWEAVQGHGTQDGWCPPQVPALWRLLREASPEVWVWEPGVAVAVGDLAVYGDVTYRALQAHTTQDGWHPPAVPALWQENTDG